MLAHAIEPAPVASRVSFGPEPGRPPAVRALLLLLDELAGLIRRIPDERFVTAGTAGRSGSVGAHVRHSLDHVDALVDGAAIGQICYDRRDRGTASESSRELALERIARLVFRVARLDPKALARPVRLTTAVTADGATLSVISTIARELAFVLSHTIHHNATMAVLLQDAGLSLPARFGYAPSTPEVSGR